MGLGSTVIGFAILSGSCPHVYSFDGQRFKLDADPLSGALFAGAEREDWDRLEELRPVDGRYRLRVVNELKEIDHIDALSLQVVDHAPGTSVLPSPSGELWPVAQATSPQAASDSHGRDIRTALIEADGASVIGQPADFAGTKSDPRERFDPDLPRPAGFARLALAACSQHALRRRSLCAVHGHHGPQGRDADALGAERHRPSPTPSGLPDEARRLGLPLSVHSVGTGAVTEIGPIGPAIQRDFVVPSRCRRKAIPSPSSF